MPPDLCRNTLLIWYLQGSTRAFRFFPLRLFTDAAAVDRKVSAATFETYQR